jgi:hypothetical protein
VPVARKLILVTKKQEGGTKATKQLRTLALRADPDHGRRVAPKSFLLRDLCDSFLLLRVEIPFPSTTQMIAALVPTRFSGDRTFVHLAVDGAPAKPVGTG